MKSVAICAPTFFGYIISVLVIVHGNLIPSWLGSGSEFEYAVNVGLSKQPINQFKPVKQSRQKALRGYCPNMYTVITHIFQRIQRLLRNLSRIVKKYINYCSNMLDRRKLHCA